MLLDGLGFFSFDYRKLSRLEGKPVWFRDKFTSIKETLLMSIALFVAICIIFSEAKLWYN